MVGPTKESLRVLQTVCTLATAHWARRSVCTRLHNEGGVVHSRRARRLCKADCTVTEGCTVDPLLHRRHAATWLPTLAADPAVDRGRADQTGGHSSTAQATRHETAACPRPAMVGPMVGPTKPASPPPTRRATTRLRTSATKPRHVPDQPWSAPWSGRPRAPVACMAVCTLAAAQSCRRSMCRRLHNDGGVLHSRRARRPGTARIRSRPGCTVGPPIHSRESRRRPPRCRRASSVSRGRAHGRGCGQADQAGRSLLRCLSAIAREGDEVTAVGVANKCVKTWTLGCR